jgi:hypothetical protein
MCVIKLFSPTIPFTDLIGDNIIPIRKIEQIGDIQSKTTGRTATVHRAVIGVSNANWESFQEQAADTIAFLRKHVEYITEIIKSHNTSNAYLDFPLNSRLGGSKRIVCQTDVLPCELLVLAGKCGLDVMMSIYQKDDLNEIINNLDDNDDA